jgi:catechol 2,3-dioxygenase-like lactoylglutathione lyase family enzyme
MLTPVPAIGRVEHVGVTFEDLSAAQELFGTKLRLPVVEYKDDKSGSFAARAGGTTIRVVSHDAPEAALGRRGVNHVAVLVDSLDKTAARLKEIGLELAQSPPPGSNGRKALWLDPKGTHGIPLQFVEESIQLKFPAPHKDAFIERIDHLGIAVHSHEQARELYVNRFAFPVECLQIDSEVLIPVETTSNDKYGSKTHVRPPISAIGSGLIALFVTVGDFDFEIMQPLGDATVRIQLGSVPGTVGQDQGAVARFLEKRGEGLLHISFKAPDIQKAMAGVQSAGIKLIDPVARPGGRGGLISFMDRRDTQGMLMHFSERTPL